MFALFFLVSLVSAAELKLTRVSDLKVGDIVVSKAGVEIPVENIVKQVSDKVTISEYLRQKVFGNETIETPEEIRVPVEKVVAAGNYGSGVISGNAIVNMPAQEKPSVGFLQSIKIKMRGWLGLQ